MKLKWLQWATHDLTKSWGGVETHARCLKRELMSLGIDAQISSDPKDLQSSWDVIQTHGSSVPMLPKISSQALHIHTMHGLTHERMLACRELLWPGGYKAILREFSAMFRADALFTVYSEKVVERVLKKLGKKITTCSNGWDAWGHSSKKAISLNDPTWLFIGRGNDFMKGADCLVKALPKLKIKLTAIPGDGFETSSEVVRTGNVNPETLQDYLRAACGVIMPSRYEGFPLVALETLSQGVPLIASPVGGLKGLSKDLQGFVRLKDRSTNGFVEALREAQIWTLEGREQRAQENQKHLLTWKDVTAIYVSEVKRLLSGEKK